VQLGAAAVYVNKQLSMKQNAVCLLIAAILYTPCTANICTLK